MMMIWTVIAYIGDYRTSKKKESKLSKLFTRSIASCPTLANYLSPSILSKRENCFRTKMPMSFASSIVYKFKCWQNVTIAILARLVDTLPPEFMKTWKVD